MVKREKWPEYKYFEGKRWRKVSVHLHKPHATKKARKLREQGLCARVISKSYSKRGGQHGVYKSHRKKKR